MLTIRHFFPIKSVYLLLKSFFNKQKKSPNTVILFIVLLFILLDLWLGVVSVMTGKHNVSGLGVFHYKV